MWGIKSYESSDSYTTPYLDHQSTPFPNATRHCYPDFIPHKYINSPSL
jgi:hypothetical protein